MAFRSTEVRLSPQAAQGDSGVYLGIPLHALGTLFCAPEIGLEIKKNHR
jgi:hypothetical protein